MQDERLPQMVNTRSAAKQLGVSTERLHKFLQEGVIDGVPRAPSGAYLWRLADVERARAVIEHRARRREWRRFGD